MKNEDECLIKQNKNDKNSCIFCSRYRKGLCESPEILFFRQDAKGKIVPSYDFQNLLYKLKNMFSTQEIIQVLANEFNVKVDRSLLFKYEKEGLLKKNQKIGQGRAAGVKTSWQDNTVSLFLIERYIRQKLGFELKKIRKYFDYLEIKEPEKLNNLLLILNSKKFKPNFKDNENYISLNYERSYLEYRELLTVATLRAFAELASKEKKCREFLNEENLSNLEAKISMDMSEIYVNFKIPIAATIIFTKEEIEVIKN